jgi:hypothetical protein
VDERELEHRIALLEHAIFGVADAEGAPGGILGELSGLRHEFHAFRGEVQRLYRMVTVATFALTGSIVGGTVTFLITTSGGRV